MLLVTIILFPLFCLYIFIRAMQEERKEKEKWEKFKKRCGKFTSIQARSRLSSFVAVSKR